MEEIQETMHQILPIQETMHQEEKEKEKFFY